MKKYQPISFRLTVDEAERLKAAATARGVSVSEFIRLAIEAQQDSPPARLSIHASVASGGQLQLQAEPHFWPTQFTAAAPAVISIDPPRAQPPPNPPIRPAPHLANLLEWL